MSPVNLWLQFIHNMLKTTNIYNKILAGIVFAQFRIINQYMQFSKRQCKMRDKLCVRVANSLYFVSFKWNEIGK